MVLSEKFRRKVRGINETCEYVFDVDLAEGVACTMTVASAIGFVWGTLLYAAYNGGPGDCDTQYKEMAHVERPVEELYHQTDQKHPMNLEYLIQPRQ